MQCQQFQVAGCFYNTSESQNEDEICYFNQWIPKHFTEEGSTITSNMQMGILMCAVTQVESSRSGWSMHMGGSQGAAWSCVAYLAHGSTLMVKLWGTHVLDSKLHYLIQVSNSEVFWRHNQQLILWSNCQRALMDAVAGLSLKLHILSARLLPVPWTGLSPEPAVFTDVTVMRFSSSHSGKNSLLLTGGSLPPSSYVNTWKHKKMALECEKLYVCSCLKYTEVIVVKLRAAFD